MAEHLPSDPDEPVGALARLSAVQPVRYRVVAGRADQDAVLACGADDVEPPIIGNLVLVDQAGSFSLAPGLDRAERHGSFAVLVPATVALSDPRVPLAGTIDALTQILDLIAPLALPDAVVVLGSGAARRIPEGVDRQAGQAQFAACLAAIHDLASARRLRVMLEPLVAIETNLIHDLQQGVDFLDRHGLARVQLVADLNHLMAAGLDLAVVEKLAARVGHVHLADTGRLAPGTGDWPISAFLSALRRGGYRGEVTIECGWQQLAEQLPAALQYVRQADADAWAAIA